MATKTTQITFELKAEGASFSSGLRKAGADLERFQAKAQKIELLPLGETQATQKFAREQEIMRDAMVAREMSITKALNRERMRKASEPVGEAMAEGANEGFAHRLSDLFGKKSALGKTVSLLKGGGAILGLSMAANALDAMADKAKAVAEQFAAGEIGAAGIADGLVKSIPILGKVYSATQTIGQILSGQVGDAVRLAKEDERRIAAINAESAAMEKFKAATESAAESRTKLNREMAMIGGTPEEQRKYQTQSSEQDELAASRKRGQALLDAADAKAKAEAQSLAEQAAALQARRVQLIREGHWEARPALNASRDALEARIKEDAEKSAEDRRIIEFANNDEIARIKQKYTDQEFQYRADKFAKEQRDRIANEMKVAQAANDYINKGFQMYEERNQRIDSALEDFFGDVEGGPSKRASSKTASTFTALQGRFLGGQIGSSPETQTAKNTADTAKATERMRQDFARLLNQFQTFFNRLPQLIPLK